jgi:hypothetical protein
MKTCLKCNIEKILSEFHIAKKNISGLEGKCKSCKSIYRKAQYQKNKHKELSKNLEWKYNNLERYKEIGKEHYRANKDRHKSLMQQHYHANKGMYRAKDAKYRATKLKATPAWANLEQIKRIYIACASISERTGVEHHVDHIIPLQGEAVCGLHVEKNLAIIPAQMNLQKSNTYNSWDTN